MTFEAEITCFENEMRATRKSFSYHNFSYLDLCKKKYSKF